MPQIVGAGDDGHRVIITVTRQPGTMNVDRRHHPECGCRTPAPPARCGHYLHTDGHHVHCPRF